MPLSNGEIKARLLAETETIVDALLQARPADETLDDIEVIVGQARRSFGASLTAALVSQHGQASVEQVVCHHCGQAMAYKGQKAKWVVGQTGAVRLKRAYYYCSACGSGFFPLG